MALKTLKGIAKLLQESFFDAACDHIVPIFTEAASGGDSGGVSYHGMGPIGIPGAKYHTMGGQNENTNLVRKARSAAKAVRNRVLNRPDYYGNFEKYNNLQM
jgi:hypothetical protein